ncbi:hypothetical protein [Metabacillus sp. Hm71]|uniref:hypothetical protein n=1 Tax=Metabacillus sp. Hm71 TaxID=3450743 RepID=UPI003F42735D
MLDAVDYFELDQMSEEELFNSQKEHKLRELYNIRTVIHNNLHKFDLATIEEYKDYLLQQLDEEVNAIDFYNNINNTYAEQNFKQFLIEYKGKLISLFDEFLCVEVN